ncbi:transmembrane protein 199 [Elysia marginata]|uniref:Transmembrane protein 199 n=1 Tax=Elysia marginata TaxID=1093978 RepID=A0AAV4H9F3_9GAST|nr:transmembrane protein 199 [Elysia marginata]
MAEECKHRQPQLRINQKIVDAAKKVVDLPNVSDSLRLQCIEIHKKQTDVVSTQTLRGIYNTLRSAGQIIFLHEMVEEAVFVPQPVIPPPRNPELEARIQKLKIEEENKEYRRMTQNLEPRGKKAFSFQEDGKTYLS